MLLNNDNDSMLRNNDNDIILLNMKTEGDMIDKELNNDARIMENAIKNIVNLMERIY